MAIRGRAPPAPCGRPGSAAANVVCMVCRIPVARRRATSRAGARGWYPDSPGALCAEVSESSTARVGGDLVGAGDELLRSLWIQVQTRRPGRDRGADGPRSARAASGCDSRAGRHDADGRQCANNPQRARRATAVPGSATSRTPRPKRKDSRDFGMWCYGASRTARSAMRGRLGGSRWCSCSGSRGAGSGQRTSPAPCDALRLDSPRGG